MDDQEVVGRHFEVDEFGAFVRIGPMEALLHKSQIMNEPVDINIGANKITGIVRSRIVHWLFVRARIVYFTDMTTSLKDRIDQQAGRLGSPGWKKESGGE